MNACPKCGGEIPADAPQGLCPKCLPARVEGIATGAKSRQGPLPGEWQIRCATCGGIRTMAEIRGVKLGGAAVGKRTVRHCPKCDAVREMIIERAGDSPIGSTPPPQTPPLRSAPCNVSTPEHLETFLGNLILYTAKGEMRMDPQSLILVHGCHSLQIPLASIVSMAVGVFPKITKPAGLNYIAVTFRNGNAMRRILFVPHGGARKPTRETNGVVSDWFEAIRQQIQSVTGKMPHSSEHDLEPLPDASKPEYGVPVAKGILNVILMLILIGAVLLAAGSGWLNSLFQR